MKNQFYIFVIVALSASSLYSQDQMESTLYHLNGLEYQGKVLEFGEEFVTFEIFSDGRLLSSPVHYKDIIKIIRSDGLILYENPESELMLARKTLLAEEKFNEKDIVSVKLKAQVQDEGLGFVEGEAEGRIFAEQNYSASGWFKKGAYSTFIPFGIFIGIANANNSEVVFPDTMSTILADKSETYKTGFYIGYSNKVQQKNRGQSIKGSLFSLGVFVVIYAVLVDAAGE